MNYNGIVISDEHFGAFDPKLLYEEHEEVFFYYLENMKKIDFIIIDGDFWDRKMYVNESAIYYGNLCMEKIVKYCKVIRIVYGTQSHESDQYNIFNIYENNKKLDFKVIKTVCDEELLPDMNVLYLPEEYVLNKDTYYEKYFKEKNKYDYVFGHGVIKEVMTQASKSTTKKDKNRKAPAVFTTGELSRICKGQVYFGHYHINVNMQDKVFYVGSYSRWIYGEEEPKGFYHITFNPDKCKYTNKFIENYKARMFKTIVYGYDSTMTLGTKDSIEKELSIADNLMNNGTYDNIRYIINIPQNHPNPEYVINLLKERYKHNNKVKLDLTNGYMEEKRKIEKEKVDSELDKFSIIFDKSVKIEDKIKYFIKTVYDKEIPLDNIKSYLYEDNNITDDEE